MATAAFTDNETNDELWRECATWLTRWEMLRTDHKANWPTASIGDLAHILRDGVLLCKLLNKIDPGCIDMKDVHLKPTMAQFLCKSNIKLFLRTCEYSFGINKCDLFDDGMLFDLSNFHKVLCSLSKLSISQKARKIPGFTAQKVKTREEEVIYQSLKTVVNVKRRSSVDAFDMTSEEIYQDLCVVRSTVEQQQTPEKRDFVIKELLDTEKNYVDVLNKLRKNFMTPLQSSMSIDDYKVIFYKINDLYVIHSAFLLELVNMRKGSQMKISNIFINYREKFLIYGEYCANLTKATTTLQELCDNNEAFNQTIIKYENEDNNGRFKLRDVLSVPMQRILKYHLLLEKLIENTDPNDEERNDLRRAREAMLDVAGYINEAARDSEQIVVIKKVQETIIEWKADQDNLRLEKYGRLIKDAEMKIQDHINQKTSNRYVFIFDRCMLICKQKGQQFAFREIINIVEFHVDDIHNRSTLKKEARFSYNFMLVRNDNQTAYTISVRTKELKQQIIKAISEAHDNISPPALKRSSHQLEFATFATPTKCDQCSKYLKGLIYQGYKCRVCEKAAHKGCISTMARCGGGIPTVLPSTNSLNLSNHSSEGLSNGFSAALSLTDKLWYVGEMNRKTVDEKLRGRENGTFLLRIRPDKDDGSDYALSLKTENIIKHMKICCKHEDVPNGEKKYFLSLSKFFRSIEELVLNYQNFSLKENFESLEENAKLLWPFKQLKAMVLKNYETLDSQELSLKEGEVITIIGTEREKDNRWFKGRSIRNEVGFFPANYVRIEGEISFYS